jgi:hypothetical protein
MHYTHKLNLRLPVWLDKRVRELAQRDEISINQFITTAVAEKMSALLTVEYLGKRAQRGRRAKFDRVLKKVRPSQPTEPD